ncbi:MAG: 16S rRNA (uracil(1498)-N(3))-methyltransferase [Hyphomicrobiaceae bacterium]
MAIHDFTSQRLFVGADLAAGAAFELEREQAHYLINVLRQRPGDAVLIFNGRDGEWKGTIEPAGRKGCAVRIGERVRAQTPASQVRYLFAPLKRARLDYMVQKAVEMGAGSLEPVLTRRTVAERINLDRMRANAVEAAEQCGVLSLPRVAEPRSLAEALDGWDRAVPLIVCDESAPVADPVAALGTVDVGPGGSVGLLVGPEGGFDEAERARLTGLPFVRSISLGPRIMRADTAAVAALALVNAVLGDWRGEARRDHA